MKRILLLLTVVVAPGLALAQDQNQPPAQPSINLPRFKPTPENLSSVALVGSFYSAMQRAKSYRGHFILTKTKTTDGKVTSEKTVDWKSSWLGDGNGNFTKRQAEVHYTEMEGDKKTEKSSIMVDDGQKSYRFLPLRNVWSEEDQTDNTDVSQAIAFMVWMSQVLAFDQGDEFKTQTRVGANGAKQLVVTDGKSYEAVFNEETGLPESWRVSGDDGEKTELRFLELELNKPVPAEAFAWKAPAGPRQVSPEETKQTVDL